MLARSPARPSPRCTTCSPPRPADLASLLASLRQVEALLDAMPGVVFFVRTSAPAMSGQPHPGTPLRREGQGRTARPQRRRGLPSSLGPLYAEQDRRVLRGGATLENQLELHLYPGRQPGWCLTHKQALRDADGRSSAWPASPTTCRRRSRRTRPTAGWRRWTRISASTTTSRSASPISLPSPGSRWRNWSVTASASSSSPHGR